MKLVQCSKYVAYMLRNAILPRWIKSTPRDLAKLIMSQNPNVDPRSLREAKVKTLLHSFVDENEAMKVAVSEIHDKWKLLYEAQLHDTAFEEAADPGEQCDGELNSWRNDRIKAEIDKDFKAPSVSAHEAATFLDKRSKKPPF